ncbi:hypothetical protein MTP99_016178 [Tenebrio molitor]|nr:hypothetical protein MTP99_016178 [Tenebrio molitor]
MKLWKVLARNSHIYANREKEQHVMELHEYKSRSPTFSDDSGRHSSSALDPQPGLLLATVQLRRRQGETLGIVLAPDKNPTIAFPLEMCRSAAFVLVGHRIGSRWWQLSACKVIPPDKPPICDDFIIRRAISGRSTSGYLYLPDVSTPSKNRKTARPMSVPAPSRRTEGNVFRAGHSRLLFGQATQQNFNDPNEIRRRTNRTEKASVATVAAAAQTHHPKTNDVHPPIAETAFLCGTVERLPTIKRSVCAES